MKHDSRDDLSVCEECGASVYKQHLESGIARYEAGRLLCAHCVAEYERVHDAAASGITEDLAPIELDEEEDLDPSAGTGAMSSTRIHSMSEATLGLGGAEMQYRRALDQNHPAASRCRTFHCRLSEGAIEFLNNQINEWLDQNDDISVKFVSSTIGLFEGKHTEQNLIMTLFY